MRQQKIDKLEEEDDQQRRQSQRFKLQMNQNQRSLRKLKRKQIFTQKRKSIMNETHQQQQKCRQIEQTKEEISRLFSQNPQNTLIILEETLVDQIFIFLSNKYSLQDLPNLISFLFEYDIVNKHEAAIGIRKLLQQSIDNIQPIIDLGAIPKLVQLLQHESYLQLQFESAWSLTNIAIAGTRYCENIVQKGVIPIFLKLINSKVIHLVDQAIWGIGNIASDSQRFRDIIIREGGVEVLVNAVKLAQQARIIQIGCWALSNLMRGDPLPHFKMIKTGYQLICKILATEDFLPDHFRTDLIWALNAHTTNSTRVSHLLTNILIIPRMIEGLIHIHSQDFYPWVCLIGSVSRGDSSHINMLVQHQIVPHLHFLLSHTKKSIRKQASFILTNLVISSKQLVEELFRDMNIILKMMKLLQDDDWEVQIQAAWFLNCLSIQGNPLQTFQFYQRSNLLDLYMSLLVNCEVIKIKAAVLRCIYKLLDLGAKVSQNEINLSLAKFQSNPSYTVYLQGLQHHQSEQIYKQVFKILHGFFEIEDPLDI